MDLEEVLGLEEDGLPGSKSEQLSSQIKKILPILDLFLENSFRTEMVGAFHRTESPRHQRWHADCGQALFRDIPVQLPPSWQRPSCVARGLHRQLRYGHAQSLSANCVGGHSCVFAGCAGWAGGVDAET